MKQRWLLYTLTGILFGIFDFYYHAFISNTLSLQQLRGLFAELVWLVLSVGIWLVPVIPVILYEARISRSTWRAALASVLTWCAAVAAYYLTNGVQLALIGVPSRPELHLSNRADPHFLENWKSIFWYDLVGGSFEWLVVAVIGGSLIGFLVSFFVLRQRRAHEGKPASQT